MAVLYSKNNCYVITQCNTCSAWLFQSHAETYTHKHMLTQVTYISIDTHIRIHSLPHVCAHMRCVLVRICAFVSVSLVCMCLYTCTCICLHVHTCVCTCIHVHAYVHLIVSGTHSQKFNKEKDKSGSLWPAHTWFNKCVCTYCSISVCMYVLCTCVVVFYLIGAHVIVVVILLIIVNHQSSLAS